MLLLEALIGTINTAIQGSRSETLFQAAIGSGKGGAEFPFLRSAMTTAK